MKSHGQQVRQAGSADEAVAENYQNKFDVVFLDLRLGSDSGIELIPKLLADSPWLKIIVMTAYSSVDTAVEAIKCGAFDYIEKPFTPEKIELVLNKAEKSLSLEHRLDQLEENYIREVIESTGSLQEAATILGINQATLWRKRKEFGFDN